jgi:membrane associated rhomboid family serine protease
MDQQRKTGFFEVSPGNFSITRLAFAFLLVNGAAQSWFVLFSDPTAVASAATIFGTSASVATGLKLIQKQQEHKHNQE